MDAIIKNLETTVYTDIKHELENTCRSTFAIKEALSLYIVEYVKGTDWGVEERIKFSRTCWNAWDKALEDSIIER